MLITKFAATKVRSDEEIFNRGILKTNNAGEAEDAMTEKGIKPRIKVVTVSRRKCG